jgi:alpha-ketoglutarate-dependent taurine dioxygenase
MEAIKRLPRVKRRAASAEPDSWVKLETLGAGGEPPLLIQPAVRGASLSDWAHANRDLVEERLLRHGALLFREFETADAGGFERFIRATSSEWAQYREPATPRSQVSENIYTSTEYPAEHAIFLHNENSHCASWPLNIYFLCLVPAASGGETPIADCRKVLSRISPSVRERFIEKKVMYVRNFGDGLGFTWQEVFNTTRQTEVAEYCRRADMDFEWKQDAARLRIRYVRPAVARRPQSGEVVWFNHATFFHISTLEPATRAALLSVLPEEDLPYNTYYGDGSPIEASVMDELRSAYLQETISFPWRGGDVLFLDNMLMAHGRAPYTGARKVLVGMADAVSGDKGD